MFLALLGLSAIEGLAFAPRCSLWRVILLVLRQGVVDERSRCSAVPLWIDFPSWLLACSAATAVVTFHLFRWRLQRLQSDLSASGVWTAEQHVPPAFVDAVQGLRRALNPPYWGRCVALVVIVVLGVWFYRQNYEDGQIFRDLAGLRAGIPGEDSPTFVVIRDGWWAGVDNSVALAVLWVLIGCVGTYFALRQAFMYHELLRVVREARLLRFNVVLPWQDKNLGWAPAGRLVVLAYAGFVNFLATFIAILYMLRQLNWIIALVAVIGVVANARVLYSLIRGIHVCHVGSVDREIEKVAVKLDRSQSVAPAARRRRMGGRNAALLVYGAQLGECRRYPLTGRARRVFAFLPALAAIVKIALDVRSYLPR